MLCLAAISETLWQTWAYLTTGRVLAMIIGGAFALLAVVLLFAARTRWGHSKPLTKCIVLSILAHVWLLMYALGERRILPQGDLSGQQQSLQVVWEEADDPQEPTAQAPTWDQPANLADLLPLSQFESSTPLKSDPAAELLSEFSPTQLPDLPPEFLDQQKPETVNPMPSNPATPETKLAGVLAAEKATNEPPTPHKLVQVDTSAQLQQQTLQPLLTNDYQLRKQHNRLEIARAYGADEDTEAAVSAALSWLSGAQSVDGSWNAARFGAGTETRALGEDRHGTGGRADTGVSGLAMLALLSAGHTHTEGPYRDNVRRGLTYLMNAQMPSGDLSGPQQIGNERGVINARMYCHSIAMLALAEAYAMTRESALRDTLLRAAQFSINAQDARGGGWRYQPGDPGDLSLFGWKAMALGSIHRSGLTVPDQVHQRMRRFLDSCAAGKGGLARYRPGEGAPSETMTAEALACRVLLEHPISLDAQQEALQMIMQHLPGTATDNVYFWYYATLALFQLQDQNWQQWNQALKTRLLETQVPAYQSQAGSWNPDTLWGGYGGRVYSTAMSCLCLEVYYRYLPLYQRSQLAKTKSPGNF